MKKNLINISLSLVLFFYSSESSAQAGLEISLRADYEQEKKVFHNEPVIFTVTLVNKTAQSDKLWNISADRRLRQIDEQVKQGKIKKEDADKEKEGIEKQKRLSPEIPAGTPSSSWTTQLKWKAINLQTKQEIALPVKLMANPASETVVLLGAGTNASAYFGISPEEMLNIPAGNYEVSISFGENTDKAVLQVQGEPVTETAMSEALLQKFGLYYWHTGDAWKTLAYAEKMLKKNPASVDAYSLKGDAQVMTGSYLPALESYNEARKLYYRQYGGSAEPPEYLLSMIGMVKEKLGDVKN